MTAHTTTNRKTTVDVCFDARGRIERDILFCPGRWHAGLLAQVAETVR
jgi:hypothetical protein